MLRKFIYFLFSLLPLKKKKVIMWGYYGLQYGCSPKYLSNYILDSGTEFKVVWGVLDMSYNLNPKIKKVKFGSIRFIYELCTSKFIVTNYRLGIDVKKRQNQVYIQTWHSSLRLKKIEKDAEQFLPKSYIEQAKRDSAKIDYLLSGCKDSTEIFKRSFWYNGNILEVGTPRIDPLLKIDEVLVNDIKKSLDINESCKVLLYAPTFRNKKSFSFYIKDFESLLNLLEKETDESWKIIVRLHPHLINDADKYIEYSDKIIDGTRHQDIQELLMISNILVTDYSSLMFDFLYTNRPIVLFIPDYDSFTKTERGIYYDIDQLPFYKAYSENELQNLMNNLNNPDYIRASKKFIKDIGTFENGLSSEKIVSIMMSHIE